jgi:hypothetical protein
MIVKVDLGDTRQMKFMDGIIQRLIKTKLILDD